MKNEYQDQDRRPRGAALYTIGAVIIVCVGAAGFAGGYLVGHATGPATAAQTGFGGMAGRGYGMRRGGFGTVSAVSTSSITITENGANAASKTYSITSTTTVTNDGSSASVSDIKTGDTVRVVTASATSTDATSIEINPSFGSGAPGQSQSSQDSSSSDPTTDGTTDSSTT